MDKITMLGTGSAMVTNCYNTCFTISNEDGHLLVDAGGGNTILVNLKKANIQINELKAMFISHTHSDHILGAPWVIRAVATLIANGKYSNTFTIYGEKSVLDALKTICNIVLKKQFLNMFGHEIIFCEVSDGDILNILGSNFTFFDINSSKLLQFGFKIDLPSKKTLCFLGDEPYKKSLKIHSENVDYLLHEAFCLYKDKDIFKPYEKHHATVKDACINAKNLNAKSLILYHTEDKNLETRQKTYIAEGNSEFNGEILIPNDFDIITL